MRLTLVYILAVQCLCLWTCTSTQVVSSAKVQNQRIDQTIAEVDQAEKDKKITPEVAKSVRSTLRGQKTHNNESEAARVKSDKKAEKSEAKAAKFEIAAGKWSALKWIAGIVGGLAVVGGVVWFKFRKIIPN